MLRVRVERWKAEGVSDFRGYPFIVENNGFLCNAFLGNRMANLETLYAHFSEILNEEFDEEALR